MGHLLPWVGGDAGVRRLLFMLIRFSVLASNPGLRIISPMTLQFRIKQLREARGLSQAALAEHVGVRQATINDLENGYSRRDTLDLLEKLARALGVEPGELFERRPAAKKKTKGR